MNMNQKILKKNYHFYQYGVKGFSKTPKVEIMSHHTSYLFCLTKFKINESGIVKERKLAIFK